ncbi:MAG: class I SAM-dependent rRNA methyltransferase, partial [Chthoniobacterales bacterium]
MELHTGILRGEAPGPFDVTLAGLKFGIELPGGQKTGLYLDQADNYALVAQHAQSKRVLDCFSNQGGFALACAKAGASHVTALDISADACAAIEANAVRNGVRLDVTETNVFDWLKAATTREERYDLIILDPPSFTRDRARLNDALRGYKEIHLRAAQLLNNGGLLATFCCSHHVSDTIFLDVIRDAMVDAKKTARLRASYTQRADHPIIVGLPESSYLKGHLFEMAPGRYRRALLDRHALGQITRFVHIATARHSNVVGEKLQRDDREHGHEPIGRVRNPQRVIGDFLQFLVSFGADPDDRAFARAHFLDVARVFLEERVARRDEDGRRV